MIGILVDVTKCTGCFQCIQACSQANHLEETLPLPQHAPDGLSAHRWATLVQTSSESQGYSRYVRKFCQHCLEPACVSVCPVGAMYKTSEGPVLYDEDKCMGCRYCMMACPYAIPRYEWDSPAPRVRKCTLCYERIVTGRMPACVEACPNQTLVFGERDDLIHLAQSRIQAESGSYLPIVYGEHQAGGASVLYLTDVPLDFLGFQGDPGVGALPDLSLAWLAKVTPISIVTAGLATGLLWIIGRRIQAEEARAAQRGDA